jgi:hypothetical protein
MGDIGKFVKKAKAERPPASGSLAAPLTEEQRERGSLFMRRFAGKAGDPKPLHPRMNPAVPSEKGPPASSPVSPENDAATLDEDSTGPVVDKMAEEEAAADPLPIDDEPDGSADALVDDLQPEVKMAGLKDERDFQPFQKVASDSIYQSDKPHPIELFKALSHDFGGLGWATWTPEQTIEEIKTKSAQPPSQVVRNMIGAMRALMQSESFWHEHHSFLWIAQALNGEVPDFSNLPELTPEQVVFAVSVANQLRDRSPIQMAGKEPVPGVVYDDQVLATIAVIFHMAGLIAAPSPLQGAETSDAYSTIGVNGYIRRLLDPAAQAMSRDVEKAWGRLETKLVAGEKPNPDDFDTGDARDMQLARLVAIWEYIHHPHAE